MLLDNVKALYGLVWNTWIYPVLLSTLCAEIVGVHSQCCKTRVSLCAVNAETCACIYIIVRHSSSSKRWSAPVKFIKTQAIITSDIFFLMNWRSETYLTKHSGKWIFRALSICVRQHTIWSLACMQENPDTLIFFIFLHVKNWNIHH